MEFLPKNRGSEIPKFHQCDGHSVEKREILVFLHCVMHTVEIMEFYCHDYFEKFRQINVLLKNFTIN